MGFKAAHDLLKGKRQRVRPNVGFAFHLSRLEMETSNRIDYFKNKQQQQKEWMEGAKLDFDALQSGEMTETALTLKNGKSYTVEQIIALLASGPQPFDPRMEGATKEGVFQRLRTFIVDVSATDAYLESNPRPDIDSIMKWKKMQIIANLELKKRLYLLSILKGMYHLEKKA